MDQSKPLILVADDQPMNLKLLCMILEKLGYASVSAENGEDAVEKTKNNNPGLVFMDLQMPKMNGFEASKTLRDMGFTMPIIAVTAGGVPDERENCLKAGINDIMTKPVKRAGIEEIFGKWLPAGGNAGSAAPVGGAETGAVSGSAVNPAAGGAGSAAPVGGTETGAVSGSVAASAAEKIRVFNAADMLDTFMNNEDTVLPLLSRFLNRTREQLENLPLLENAAEWDDARREAHMIRGAALTMGGAELGKAAGVLEQAYKDAAADEMKAAYSSLCEAFDRFKTEAEAFIRSRS